MTKREKAIRDAEKKNIEIIRLTVDDAKAIGGMLGRICAAELQYNGFYGCVAAGVKRLYVAA